MTQEQFSQVLANLTTVHLGILQQSAWPKPTPDDIDLAQKYIRQVGLLRHRINQCLHKS